MLSLSTGYYSARAAEKLGHDIFLTRAGERVRVTHVVSNLDELADFVEDPYYSDTVCVGKIMTWIERRDRQMAADSHGIATVDEGNFVSFGQIVQDNDRQTYATTVDRTAARTRAKCVA